MIMLNQIKQKHKHKLNDEFEYKQFVKVLTHIVLFSGRVCQYRNGFVKPVTIF